MFCLAVFHNLFICISDERFETLFSNCHVRYDTNFKKEMCFIYGDDIFKENFARSRMECAAYCYENVPCIWFAFDTITRQCTLVMTFDHFMASIPAP